MTVKVSDESVDIHIQAHDEFGEFLEHSQPLLIKLSVP
jgi:hypothetical protein